MTAWRFPGSRFPLVNSEGARLTGDRSNQPGTAVIHASESIVLAAMEVTVHHGGIPEDNIPEGWPEWVEAAPHAAVRGPSATMSLAGYNYVLNPAHPDFPRVPFRFEPDFRLDTPARPR